MTADLIVRIRAKVADELASQRALVRWDNVGGERAYAASLIARALAAHAAECLRTGQAVLDEAAEATVTAAVMARLWEAGSLQPLLDDDAIVNIKANGCDGVWIDYADGTTAAGPAIAESDEAMIEAVRELARRAGMSERTFDVAHPWLNVQLPDGSRLFAVGWVCPRPQLAIRRNRLPKHDLGDLVGMGAVTSDMAEFLGAAVRARLNLLVDGGQGCGKTTLLRALAAAVTDSHERIVTIESDYELGLDRMPERHADVIALEARPANVEGVGEVTMADLVPIAMRLSTSRLIVGEILRDEVVPALNAWNAGAHGMATVHANSSAHVFSKLALLAAQSAWRLPFDVAARLAAENLDLVVHLEPSRPGPGGYVASVREVVGFDGDQVLTNEVFNGAWNLAALRAVTRDRLEEAGWRR